MPAAESSLRITEAYRSRLFAIRGGLEGRAVALWNAADDLNDFTWTNRAAAAVEQAQNEAVALTGGYLSAFLSSEVGARTRGPTLDRKRYSGLSRDGRPLRDALRSPMIGFRLKLAEGEPVEAALKFGLDRAKRMVSVDYDHAHRTALTDGLAADERFQGWQRAVTGTCGACAGDIAVEVRTELPSIPLQVHPNCQCVTEPVVASRPPPVRVLERAGTPVQGMAEYNSRLHGSARAQLSIAERRSQDETIEAIRKAHRWPEAEAIPMRPVDGGPMGSFKQSAGVPQEIAVKEGLGIQQTATTVAHEMGHYLDNLLSQQMVADRVIASRGFATEWPGLAERGIKVGQSKVGSALQEFLDVARKSPTMRVAKSSLDEDAWEYINAPEEIWARAYSQWVTGKTSQQGSWEIGDFEPVGKAVEKVLEAAGLR